MRPWGWGQPSYLLPSGHPWVSGGWREGRQLHSESWLCLSFFVALVTHSRFGHAPDSQIEPGGAAGSHRRPGQADFTALFPHISSYLCGMMGNSAWCLFFCLYTFFSL